MGGDGEQIAINHEILTRSAARLRRAAGELAGASRTIAGAPLSGTAFGLMNSWMIAPIYAVSNNSVEHLRVSGEVVEVVASATEAAANDFDATEGDILLWVEQLDAELAAAQAPPAEDGTP